MYNLLQPEAASELGARKAESVLATGAPLLISANPGCSLQIASALARRGQDIAVAHTAEVLDASIRGRPLLRFSGWGSWAGSSGVRPLPDRGKEGPAGVG